MSVRVLIITPVRNEAARLHRVVDAMAAQRRPPDRWVVVDDCSDDGSFELLSERAADLPFMEVLRAPRQRIPADADRLRVAADAVAFNHGLRSATADGQRFDFVGKLDADIELDAGHYERMLAEFGRDPGLGLAGCYLEAEREGRWVVERMPDYHVNGALKLYRRECFEEIGGMPERLGWDTADEIHARLLGWRTRSLRDLRARHLKVTGTASGVVRGSVRHGECAWIVNYPASIAVARTVKLLSARPRAIVALAYLLGYLRARLRRRPQWPDAEVRRAAREEQRRRLRRELRTRLGGARSEA